MGPARTSSCADTAEWKRTSPAQSRSSDRWGPAARGTKAIGPRSPGRTHRFGALPVCTCGIPSTLVGRRVHDVVRTIALLTATLGTTTVASPQHVPPLLACGRPRSSPCNNVQLAVYHRLSPLQPSPPLRPSSARPANSGPIWPQSTKIGPKFGQVGLKSVKIWPNTTNLGRSSADSRLQGLDGFGQRLDTSFGRQLFGSSSAALGQHPELAGIATDNLSGCVWSNFSVTFGSLTLSLSLCRKRPLSWDAGIVRRDRNLAGTGLKQPRS